MFPGQNEGAQAHESTSTGMFAIDTYAPDPAVPGVLTAAEDVTLRVLYSDNHYQALITLADFRECVGDAPGERLTKLIKEIYSASFHTCVDHLNSRWHALGQHTEGGEENVAVTGGLDWFWSLQDAVTAAYRVPNGGGGVCGYLALPDVKFGSIFEDFTQVQPPNCPLRRDLAGVAVCVRPS